MPPAASVRPFPFPLGRVPGPLGPRRRAGLGWFLADGILSQASDSLQGDYVVLFALAAGARVEHIGLLASVAGLCAMAAHLPGAALSSGRRRRKGLILLTGGVLARSTVPMLALLPFLTRDSAALITALILLRGLQAFAAGLAAPAWTSLVADLVLPALRGRYFAFRNTAIGLVALAASPLAGWLVKAAGGPSPGDFRGYQAAFALAFLLGMSATASFARIPEPPSRRRTRARAGLRGLAALMRRNPAFAWLSATACLWGFSMGIAGSFYNVYLVRAIGGTAADVGINAGLAAAASLLGQPLFGRMVDRRGSRSVFLLTGLLIPLLPLLWLFVRAPFHAYPVNAVSGFFWAGFNLAAFNLLLETSPADDRETAVAFYQTLVAASAVAGPLLGGALVGAIGFLWVFCLSGAGRMAAMALFIAGTRRIHDSPMRAAAIPGPSSSRSSGSTHRTEPR